MYDTIQAYKPTVTTRALSCRTLKSLAAIHVDAGVVLSYKKTTMLSLFNDCIGHTIDLLIAF